MKTIISTNLKSQSAGDPITKQVALTILKDAASKGIISELKSEDLSKFKMRLNPKTGKPYTDSFVVSFKHGRTKAHLTKGIFGGAGFILMNSRGDRVGSRVLNKTSLLNALKNLEFILKAPAQRVAARKDLSTKKAELTQQIAELTKLLGKPTTVAKRDALLKELWKL